MTKAEKRVEQRVIRAAVRQSRAVAAKGTTWSAWEQESLDRAVTALLAEQKKRRKK